VPAVPTPHPSDRSDNRCPPADRSDGAPAFTCRSPSRSAP
jgi:hypothetical protein